MFWNKIFVSTIHEHQDLRGTQSHKENVAKTLVPFYSWLPFPSHQSVTREAILALKENSNRLSPTSVWSSASYGRESTGGTKKIQYRTFIWRFLRQEEEMQVPQTSPYPLRLLPRPQRTGQGLKDEAKKKKHGRKPKHIADFTISYN